MSREMRDVSFWSRTETMLFAGLRSGESESISDADEHVADEQRHGDRERHRHAALSLARIEREIDDERRDREADEREPAVVEDDAEEDDRAEQRAPGGSTFLRALLERVREQDHERADEEHGVRVVRAPLRLARAAR